MCTVARSQNGLYAKFGKKSAKWGRIVFLTASSHESYSKINMNMDYFEKLCKRNLLILLFKKVRISYRKTCFSKILFLTAFVQNRLPYDQHISRPVVFFLRSILSYLAEFSAGWQQ
jgi:hypothetical protein